MKKLYGLFLLGNFICIPGLYAAGIIDNIEMVPAGEATAIKIYYQGKGKFSSSLNETNSSLVIEGEDIELPANLSRVIEGASENNIVLQVTPYKSQRNKKSLSKLVLNLRGQAVFAADDSPGLYKVLVRNKSLEIGALEKSQKLSLNKRSSWAESDRIVNKSSISEKSEALAKKLVDVLNADPESKKYFGSNVTFVSENAEIHDVLRLVSEASGLNIVTESGVKSTASYALKDVPWDQLLDIVIQQASLKALAIGGVVRITTLDSFNKVQEEKKKEIILGDELEPTVMGVIPLNFAKAEDMKIIIAELLVATESGATASSSLNIGSGSSPDVSGKSAASSKVLAQAFKRGKVQVDERSNSLIVTNTKSAIERIRRLVQELDNPMPQVLIDSKIVIASEKFSRTIGVNYAGKATSAGTGAAGAGLAFNGGTTTLGSSATLPTLALSSKEDSGVFGFQLGSGLHGNISALLSLSEADSQAKTIASPRIITTNKKAATIADKISVTVNSGIDTNGNQKQEQKEVGLELAVTPQITSSGSVFMSVSISKGAPEKEGLTNKNISTNVMVDSGSTLVLGGVYQFANVTGSAGIPLLRDLPFIGSLFRTDTSSNSKSELMVFITPQILEASKGGGASM